MLENKTFLTEQVYTIFGNFFWRYGRDLEIESIVTTVFQ